MDKNETMRQQVDVYLTLDVDVEQDITLVEQFIKVAIDDNVNPEILEVVGIKIYEEADIYGNSSASEELSEALGQALDWISELTGDDSNEELEKNNDRWQSIQSIYSKHTGISNELQKTRKSPPTPS